MSYYNPSQPPYSGYGQNPYGQSQPGYAPPPGQSYYPPPGGPPPGQGYGVAPQGSYPPPSGPPPPPAGGYAAPSGPPPGSYPPPGGAPQGAYPPPAGPPPGGYPPPSGPQQGMYPPPGGSPYGGGYAPPSGPPPSGPTGYNTQYGQPPPPQQQQQGYGTPAPPQQYLHQQDPLTYLGVPIPDPLAPPNTFTLAGYDPTPVVERIRKATKGFGTDDTVLIRELAPLDALQLATVSQKYTASFGKGLASQLESETSSYFREGLRGVAYGPIGYDVHLLDEALGGAGTKEQLLTELLMGRSNSDLRHLTNAYNRSKGRDALLAKVKGDLSAKTERLFVMALSATRAPDNMPVDHNLVQSDVKLLYKAGQGKMGTDEITFCDILTSRSYPHITALTDAYPKAHKKSLGKVIKSEFSGHMKGALLHIVQGCQANKMSYGLGVWRDMKLIEGAMKGMGTKDQQLVWRLCRNHWDHQRMASIRMAYKQKYRKELQNRVDGETGGSYKRLMVALVQGSG